MKYRIKEIRMQIRFATERKAIEASTKHFGGKLTADQMVQLTAKVIKNAEYVGQSDRSNGKYEPGKIVWSTIAGIMIAVVLDGRDIKKNIATVVSIYDVRNPTHKAKKFGMKKVVR